MKFTLEAIGKVKQDKGQFSLELNPEIKEALQGLEGFSHIQVYWWAHELDMEETRSIYKVPKPYKKGPEELGIYATRSPMRPNPLAMTVVPVLHLDMEKGTIMVPYMDAVNDTPIVDIKPYYGMERVKGCSVPQWCSHWPEWYEDAGTFDWEAEFENAQ